MYTGLAISTAACLTSGARPRSAWYGFLTPCVPPATRPLRLSTVHDVAVTARHVSSMAPEMTMVRPRGTDLLRTFVACVPLEFEASNRLMRRGVSGSSTLVKAATQLQPRLIGTSATDAWMSPQRRAPSSPISGADVEIAFGQEGQECSPAQADRQRSPGRCRNVRSPRRSKRLRKRCSGNTRRTPSCPQARHGGLVVQVRL